MKSYKHLNLLSPTCPLHAIVSASLLTSYISTSMSSPTVSHVLHLLTAWPVADDAGIHHQEELIVKWIGTERRRYTLWQSRMRTATARASQTHAGKDTRAPQRWRLPGLGAVPDASVKDNRLKWTADRTFCARIWELFASWLSLSSRALRADQSTRPYWFLLFACPAPT